MDAIRVDKQELLKILKENRQKHRQIFLEAQEGFKKAVIRELERRLEAARKGKRVDMYVNLAEPRDQTKDYDRAIGMLEMTKDEVISLKEGDYSQYVLDDWQWKQQFLTSNSVYSNTAAVALAAQEVAQEEIA